MTQQETQLKRIQDKVQQLIKRHTGLRKENQQLREKLDDSQKQAQQQLANMEKLKQQVDILSYTGGGDMDAAAKKAFEKRISTYLKEIDRCIAFLSQ